MQVLLLLLFLSTGAVLGGKILAPDEDFYLLVTLKKGTTCDEFKSLFNFYLNIRTSCSTCIPPITNIFTTIYFGQLPYLPFNSVNTTAEITNFINTTDFCGRFLLGAQTNFTTDTCSTGCLDIEWLLTSVATVIGKTKIDPSMRIRKKSVALITNYYYEPGLAYQLYRVLYPNFNFTFISLFVPNTHFLDMEALNESPIPSQVFDMSDKNLDFGKASEDFLNRFIDFNYEESESPVTGFIEVSNPSLPLALSFYSSVFDTKMCRYFNDSKHYELSLLIYFDFYQYQLNLIIPNLQAYTYSYVDLLVSSYLNATNLQEPTGHCNETNEMFYSKIVQRLNNSEPYLEQFNFYVTDNYPHCLVKYLKLNGVKADSYENHFEVFIHSSPNDSKIIDKKVVYEKITSQIISPIDASNKSNHVSVVDLSNSTSLNLFGICLNQTFHRRLIPAVAMPQSWHRMSAGATWGAICGILVAFFILSGVIIWLLTKFNEKVRRKTFLKRRETERSRAQTRLRLASTLVAASNFAAEVAVEGQGPVQLQYLHWRICPTLLELDFTKILGKGSSATIYSAFLNGRSPLSRNFASLNTQHFHNCTVAVKASLVYALQNSEQFTNEVKSMTILGWHPNICAFLGWSMARDRPCLVFECVNGDLLQYVKGFRDGELPPTKDILSIVWQIANGMAYIAQQKLVHRDLACRNILLTEDLRVKITDFGLCCDCDHSYTYTGSITKKLPIKWLSPEALLDRLFSEKSDVWALGVLVYEILTCGIVPYATMSNEEMLDFLRSGKRLDAPDGSPISLAELMKDCWHADPKCRPTFCEIRSKVFTHLNENSETYGYLLPSDLYRHQTSVEMKRHSIYPAFSEEHNNSGQ